MSAGGTGSAAFIGGGVMAEAMVSRALARGSLDAARVSVAEPLEERRDHLRETYGVVVTPDNAAAVEGAELVVLAVKPQSFAEVAAALRGRLTPAQTVLSIMAGVPIAAIADGLGQEAVIRAMPNTPARIGAGFSVWSAAPAAGEAARARAAELLGALGEHLYAADEAMVDKATAVSGSGPAYLFRFVEALTDSAQGLGFDAADAQRLAVRTALGAAQLAAQAPEPPATLREMVTSKGGTTEAALAVLEARGFGALMDDAVQAAYRRALELGGKA